MIPAWVERYIGIPYVEGGCSHAGCDCFGLLVLIWREIFKIELPAYAGPHWKKGANPAEIGAAIAAEVARYQRVNHDWVRMGDGVILRMNGHPLHVGLVVEPGWMIHTHERAAACLEDYRRIAWSRRIVEFLRYTPPELPSETPQ
jgi:cell wall-associated NlpC family hydrolase